ncbi:aldehyde dehydrogenase (NADP(+)) [Nitrospirillum viridazoti]|uniref:Aldehyde dehydrogenase (NADP(+)) n=1 Tax=Nitrospirillum viridazoti CBAmc TaxID=1441467 RepID=A0A248JUS5_9PROT|nr:aldehyde dehydrogenase (NADP(+)) [Nitrospirillum amazonense]ASG22455.1 aldehyde dehydrogenase (NADP(+)) [Nitrospirillum amazonense CBAmc]TWB43001.1 NADP-dependent aldehyde dehydrogenase [Nitrospirillum amazonense]
MSLHGKLLIGSARVATDATFTAIDPATNGALDTAFAQGGPDHVAQACALAWEAFDTFRETSLELRASLLEKIADNILALGDALLERVGQESGLPRARLEGERGRTMGQLRLFASVVRQGDWLGVRVDPAMPERKPLPRADLRLRHIPVGPVAVFGASNFPLAFSVAGGDTASALAAGCPVVVKGHPAHPGASEMVGEAIAAAVKELGLPEGVFSLLSGTTNELGGALVADPRIKAVGFTGSRAGGLALVRIAQSRPEPIPVYAEMSSINPVLLMPAALKARAEALGQAFVGSLTMGAGQFCTNPGLIIAVESPDLERFIAAATEAIGKTTPLVMLTPGIAKAYKQGVKALADSPSTTILAQAAEGEGNTCSGVLFSVTAADFLADPALAHEVFGSSSVIVRCPDVDAVKAVLEGLEGQLTATMHLDEADYDAAAALLPTLERRVGRILANAWPTGVEVCHSMVHGGPYPATSDARTTSVGTLAIDRFLRPVCYQDLPDALLPAAVKHGNPLGLNRRVDGVVQPGK